MNRLEEIKSVCLFTADQAQQKRVKVMMNNGKKRGETRED